MKGTTEHVETTQSPDEEFRDEESGPLHPRHDNILCNRCGNPAYVASSRPRFVMWLLIAIILMFVWAGLVSLYIGQHVLETGRNSQQHPTSMIDQCKNNPQLKVSRNNVY